MASYGYGGGGGGGGGYSTTSYGAQGGAEGGGFLGGSQSGSQETPGGTRTYGKETMRPVTIKQLIDATRPHPDAAFKIDNSDITQLSLVAQVNSVSVQATNTTYKVDDGTGLIDVKKWSHSDADPSLAKPPQKEGEYIRVFGRLKDFNGRRHVEAHILRPVTDFNEVNYHLLEATAVHLYFTRGPPDAINGAVKGENVDGMFVDSYGGNAANGGGAVNAAAKNLPRMSASARKVFTLLQSAPQNNEGLHVHNIATQLSIPMNDVWKASDELLGEGLIYTTVDEETFAVLEN